MTAPPMKPTVPEVLQQVRAYYAKPGNGAGGNLHVVLEDGNISNGMLEFCVEDAEDVGDRDAVAIINTMMRMSRTQRAKLARSRKR